MVELAHLILGIRVFNFDIGKGGAGIVDVSRFANDAVSDLERKLQVRPLKPATAGVTVVGKAAVPASCVGTAPFTRRKQVT